MMPQKSIEKRLDEMMSIRKKMMDLGLPSDHPQIRALIDVMNEFVRGVGFTGTVPLSDFGRVALVKLVLRDGIESEVTLRALKTS